MVIAIVLVLVLGIRIGLGLRNELWSWLITPNAVRLRRASVE